MDTDYSDDLFTSDVDEILSCIMSSKTSETNLKVITLNVRGLRDSKKRQSLIY